MAKEPEQVLPQKRRAAFVPCKLAIDRNQRNKKAGAEIPVHQQQDACRKKHAERQQSEDGGDEPGPDREWHAHHGYALCAHIERRGDEGQRAHQRAETKNGDAGNPQVGAQSLTRTGGLQRAKWGVTSPTVKRCAASYEESRK